MNASSRSHYWRLSALSAGTALVFALLLLIGLRWVADRQQLLDDLTVQADLVGANLTAAIVFDDRRTAAEILNTLDRSPAVREAAVYDSRGVALARYLRASAAGGTPLGERAPPPGHHFSLTEVRLATAVALDQRVVGVIALRASLDPLYRGLGRFFGGMLAIAMVAAAVGHYASRRLRLRMASAERELERMALYDNLTGLANRHALSRDLTQALHRHAAEGGGCALLHIGVDGFKKINELHGHAIGDQVLIAIGERLRGVVRGADLVARVGGDEFAILLADVTAPEIAERTAEELVSAGADPIATRAGAAHVGLSIGIAMLPRDGAEAASALRHADIAMQHAKRLGKRNHQFYSDNLGNSQRRRLDLEAAMRDGLTHDEFYILYQPLRSARHGGIEGLEALLRWRQAERGIISPAEFIPIAEECGLIHELGQRVLEQVCRDIAEMRGAGRVVPPIAINVSAQQVARGQIADDIVAALDRYRLPRQALEVELTESVLMDRIEEQRQVLDRLNAAGIAIAIDDFGTGYSSLNYLRHLPVRKLKIDMSFVRDLPEKRETLSVIEGIVHMAHSLKLVVTAEGVESAAQADCLQLAGCDLLQGYHVGLPMRKQEILLFLPSD